MAWSTMHLKVTTPMFCGGAEGRAELRVPSIRGAMRFWFRAMAGAVIGNDIDRIARAEVSVFGSTEAAGPFAMRAAGSPVVSSNRRPEFLTATTDDSYNDRFQGIAYLLGPGLVKRVDRQFELSRSYISEGSEVDVQFRRKLGCTDAQWSLALISMWLLCNFGGLGARVRRGFGSVEIVGLDDTTFPIPGSGATGRLAFSTIQRLTGIDLTRIVPTLPALFDEVLNEQGWTSVPWPALSSYPILGTTHTRMCVSQSQPGVLQHWPSWQRAAVQAGYDLRLCRAPIESPDANYRPQVKTREWLDVVHNPGITRFPLAAFGLPVIFKPNIKVNLMDGPVEARRASPLWLKFIQSGPEWYLLSTFFRTTFVPEVEGLEVRLSAGGPPRQLVVDAAAMLAAERSWFEGE